MPKFNIKSGTTSKSVKVKIYDSTRTDGGGLTGLVFNSSALIAYYIKEGDATATAITLVTATVGTWTSSGFIQVDSTHMPGIYEIGIPNAALTGKSVLITLSGAANMAQCEIELQLDATDNQNAVTGGMSALPSASPAASGGLPTVNASNQVTIIPNSAVSVAQWNGTNVATPATAGIPDINVKNMNNVAATPITTIKAVQGLTTADTIATYTGNTPQTGDAFARLGVAGVGLTNLGDSRIGNLDAAVSTRMATYTQPAGFLAATFPTGTIANTTNITAGTITTTTNLTNTPSVGDFTAAMKTSLNASTPASVTGAVGSISGVTFPTHFSTFAIDTSGFVTFNNISIGSVTGAVGSVTGLTTGAIATAVAAAVPTDASITTDVETGLTAQGLTTVRVGYLDTLNGIIANMVTAVFSDTVDGTITFEQKQILDLAILNGKYSSTTLNNTITTTYYNQEDVLVATSVVTGTPAVRTWTFTNL